MSSSARACDNNIAYQELKKREREREERGPTGQLITGSLWDYRMARG